MKTVIGLEAEVELKSFSNKTAIDPIMFNGCILYLNFPAYNSSKKDVVIISIGL